MATPSSFRFRVPKSNLMSIAAGRTVRRKKKKKHNKQPRLNRDQLIAGNGLDNEMVLLRSNQETPKMMM